MSAVVSSVSGWRRRPEVERAFWWVANALSVRLVMRPSSPPGGRDLPLPPAHLMRAATGQLDARYFLETGAYAARDISAMLLRNGRILDDYERVLDFGCGAGRVIRHWRAATTVLHGCDVNAALVAWCEAHLPFMFAHTSLRPPLPYPDGHFDFVYALSVFTHLDADGQHEWMDELSRVLRPGGLALVTTHGDRSLHRLDAAERERFASGETVVLGGDAATGSNEFGTYQNEDNVRRLVAGRFEVADVAPWGALGLMGQDMYLLRRPDPDSS